MIADFGHAVFIDNPSGKLISERGGNVLWLAPERQVPPVRPATPSDVYSFAITCVEVNILLCW